MRIVHFSDPHAWGGPSGIHRPDKRVLGTFNHLMRRQRLHEWTLAEQAVEKIRTLNADIVVCTGDLSTISAPREFEQAVKTLMPLVEDTSFDLLYVPGNHDHYIHDKRCLGSLRQAFRTMNRERWELEDLPLAHTCAAVQFALIDEACPEPVYSSAGAVNEATLTWFPPWLDGQPDETAICLVHHFPLYDSRGNPLSRRRGSRNNAVLQQALHRSKAQLSLCGHIHVPFIRREDSGGVEICAGSVTACGSVGVIDFDPVTKRIDHKLVDVQPG
jgi:3',5'-cyclic AMP phosphodiesterase CpdA